ncbi:hypothetical protein FBALC1_04492 [Flavobacteriales bacterium ALC-1]|nr:hypothetical protein FBALC1_04492 [Flavobacteriales bacterium ALC-1]
MKRIVYLLLLLPFTISAQFSVSSTTPASNELDVSVTSDISINFNQNVDAATLTNANISITGNNGIVLGFSAPIVTGTNAIFNPDRDFFPGEIITITITTDVENSSGTNLNKAFTFQFTAEVCLNSPGQFPLGENTISLATDGAISVTIADLDDDGDLDILSASSLDDRIAWYANDGTGKFGVQQTITTSADYAHRVTTADLDGDGDIDVISASSVDDRIAWYENDGLGNFGPQQTITTAANLAYNVIASDLDQDGDMDVISASAFDGLIAWYENDGLGNFGALQTITTAAPGARSVYIADLDNDGDIDVLSASSDDDRVAWYENDGSGNFGAQQTITTLADRAFSVKAADLDGDGDMDVIAACSSTSTARDWRITWYENLGSGTFGPQQTISINVFQARSVYTADLDGDGDLDVLSASSRDDRIAWYENDGSGSFGAQQTVTTNADGAWSIVAADLDGDGDMDLISGDYNGDRVAWYENAVHDDRTLATLGGTDLVLSPPFDPNVSSYTAAVCNSVLSTTINATVTNSGDTIGGTGLVNLNEGTNMITVSVTDQCGGTDDYTVEVTRVPLITQQITWSGSVSTDWNNPNNWTPNIVPLECLEIIIPETTNQPLISPGVINIKDLNINSGSNLEIPVGATLNVSDDLNMYSESDTYSGIIVKGVLSVSGKTKYHRYTNSQANGNDLIAPPLSGQSWTSFLTNDANHNEGLIYNNGANPVTTYLFGPFEKGATDDYILYNDNSSEFLISGKGYRSATNTVNGDALIFTGSIVTGAVNTTIINETTGGFPEWNLIGNPYPTYIDVNTFLNHVGSVSGVTNLSLLSDSTAAVYGYDGDDTDVSGSVWTYTNLVEGPTLIAPGQGFFVSSKYASSNIEFTPDMQIKGSSDDFIQGRTINNTDYIKLNAATSSKSYSTSFYFHNNGSQGLDKGYDAAVFGGALPSFSLYSHLVAENEGIPMVIQTLSSDDIGNVIVPLGLNVNNGEQVTISLGNYNIPDNVSVYLEDNVNNTFTRLDTTDYIFTTVTALNGTGRFYLHFTTESLLSTGEHNFKEFNIYTNQLGRTIIIEGNLTNKVDVVVFDILGREVLRQDLNHLVNKNIINANTLGSGVYVITIEDGNRQYSQKLILK